MSAAKLAFLATALFAVSLSLSIFSPDSALAAESCLAAPNGPAPEGSHWFYRLERPSLRKCWHLVQQDRGSAQTATRAAPQAAPQAEPDDAPAAVPPGPVSNVTPLVPAEPVIRTLVTRNASNTDELTQPPAVPDTSASAATPDAAPAPLVPAPRDEPAPAIAKQPVAMPAVATDPVTITRTEGSPVLRWTLAAVALLGLLACAAFFVLGIMRRRSDVLTMVHEAEAMPYAHSPETAPADEVPVDTDEAPTFAPLPPISLAPREDDVDQALRRFTENFRRRAA